MNNTVLLTLLREKWTIPLLLEVCNSTFEKGNLCNLFAILFPHIFAILSSLSRKLKKGSFEAPVFQFSG